MYSKTFQNSNLSTNLDFLSNVQTPIISKRLKLYTQQGKRDIHNENRVKTVPNNQENSEFFSGKFFLPFSPSNKNLLYKPLESSIKERVRSREKEENFIRKKYFKEEIIKTGYYFPKKRPECSSIDEIIVKKLDFTHKTIEKSDIYSKNKQFKVNSLFLYQYNGQKNDNDIKLEIRKKLIFHPKLNDKYFNSLVKNNKKFQCFKRKFLVIENVYLDQCKTKNDIKYCYTEIPFSDEIKLEKEINEEFLIIKFGLADYFNLNSKNIYLFLKDGNSINSHYDINFKEKTLIISGNQCFKGIFNCTYEKIKRFFLLKTIKLLEKPLETQKIHKKQTLSYEKTIKSRNKKLYEDVLNIVSDSDPLNSSKLEKIYKNINKNKKIFPILSQIEQSIENPEFLDKKNAYFSIENLSKPLKTSKKFKEISKIHSIYKKGLRKLEAGLIGTDIDKDNESEEDSNLGSPLKLSHNKEKDDNININLIEKIAVNLDFLLEKWEKRKKIVEKIEENEDFDYNSENKKEIVTKVNFVEKNKKEFITGKRYLQILQKKNREIFLQNLPKLIKETHLSRRELHSIYILYKALQEVTSQKYTDYNLDDGLDYYTFRNGIYQVFVQSEKLAKRIFRTIDYNFSDFLNWQEFLNLMVIIRAKTLKEKIDLFIKIADEDGNGMLSKDEILKLCKICLSKYVKEEENETFLDDLCEYFAKLIFSAVEIDEDKEIPLNTIKNAILYGNEESDLLAMFCGADI